MTRKVKAHLFNSVNGVVESPDKWQFDAFGPEDMEGMSKAIGDVTDVIIGRKLWQEWAQYWPNPAHDDPFSQFINPVAKHVVTSSLDDASAWNNSTIVTGDPVEYVRRLSQDGSEGSISVAGGIETIRSLFLAGVIDELTLTTHPVVGVGRRLFDDSVPITRLELLNAVSNSSGNAVLTYRLRPQD